MYKSLSEGTYGSREKNRRINETTRRGNGKTGGGRGILW